MENSTEEQIKDFHEMCYTDEEVDTLLKENKLDSKKFGNWINGQTGLLIFQDGKGTFGYFKSDVNIYIKYAVKGQSAPIWD